MLLSLPKSREAIRRTPIETEREWESTQQEVPSADAVEDLLGGSLVAQVHDRAEVRELLADLQEALLESVVFDDGELRLAVGGQVGDLLGRARVVDRDRGGAGASLPRSGAATDGPGSPASGVLKLPPTARRLRTEYPSP